MQFLTRLKNDSSLDKEKKLLDQVLSFSARIDYHIRKHIGKECVFFSQLGLPINRADRSSRNQKQHKCRFFYNEGEWWQLFDITHTRVINLQF